jgi:CBS domain containing-hemolysin-like protein
MFMPLLKLLAAFFFVAMNAFFVLSEFAVVKIRKTRLEELSRQGNSRADLGLKLVNNLDSYLSAMQLGITLASLALGWLGEPAIAYLLRPLFERLNIGNPMLIHTVSIAIAFTMITFMHVVLGELVPKSIAIQKTERVVLLIATPMLVFHKLVYPIVYLFDHIAAFSLRILGMTPSKDSEQVHSEEELKMLVNASHTDGVLDDTEGRIIGNMFGFADKIAREVMIPRTDMLCLYLDDSYEDNLKEVLAATFTRFPLCRTDKDNVIGMIHLRDILENETTGHSEGYNLEKLVREVLFVPETQHITDIMQLMRKKQIHMAVVIDEYGGTAGIITLEDIIEEIVGEINDEYDKNSPDTRKLSENTYEINGLTEQGVVEKLLNIDLGDQDDETIGGFVFSLLGRKPEEGDKVSQCSYVFEVTEVNGLRISKIRAYPVEGI